MVVTGRKKGTAKVKAVVGKKKLSCTVIVKNGSKPAATNSPMPSASVQQTVPHTPTPPSVTKAPPVKTQEPSDPSVEDGKNEQDVAALKALIIEQR